MLTRRQALGLPAALRAVPLFGQTASLAIAHATVIDGNGAELHDRTITITGNRISEISNQIPRGARVVDARGLFVIPGLWDMHVHLSLTKASALPAFLANGVTGVRDMGGLLRELDEWRVAIASGARPGPGIYRAGPMLNGKTFNEFQIAVEDAQQARGAVRALHKAGVDFIKVHAAILRDAYRGVKEEADRLGIRFVGHIPRDVSPEETSAAGQLTLEHVQAFVDRFSRLMPPDKVAPFLARFRKEEAPRLFDLFAKSGSWFTPTLTPTKTAIHLGDHQPDPRDRYVSKTSKAITADLMTRPEYQEMIRPASVARQEREFGELVPLTTQLHKSGVGLLAGTDTGASILYPGFSLHDELALLVEAGLTPIEALQAATRNPARAMHRDDIGTVEVGKLADLVLLSANPLADIRNTTKIHAVVYNGELHDRRSLDALLRRAENEARES
jgi:imidazolonepropionase-like amidohydrolase